VQHVADQLAHGIGLGQRLADQFPVGGRFEGPAEIEQPDSTTIVLPGWSGVVDPNGNLILTLQ